MSEMLPVESPSPSTGNSPLPAWRSLRLLVAPAYPSKLIVSLVVIPRNGHPTLHPQLRQLEAPWFPQTQSGDLDLYALRIAFLRASQTVL